MTAAFNGHRARHLELVGEGTTAHGALRRIEVVEVEHQIAVLVTVPSSVRPRRGVFVVGAHLAAVVEAEQLSRTLPRGAQVCTREPPGHLFGLAVIALAGAVRLELRGPGKRLSRGRFRGDELATLRRAAERALEIQADRDRGAVEEARRRQRRWLRRRRA